MQKFNIRMIIAYSEFCQGCMDICNARLQIGLSLRRRAAARVLFSNWDASKKLLNLKF